MSEQVCWLIRACKQLPLQNIDLCNARIILGTIKRTNPSECEGRPRLKEILCKYLCGGQFSQK